MCITFFDLFMILECVSVHFKAEQNEMQSFCHYKAFLFIFCFSFSNTLCKDVVTIVVHNDVKLIFFPENILEGGPQQENKCSSELKWFHMFSKCLSLK